MSEFLGIDIGGTHISVGLIECNGGGEELSAISTITIDSEDSADRILDLFSNQISEFIESNNVNELQGIGVSIPGPFEYDDGVSKITEQNKYEKLFGLNLKQSLLSRLGNVIPSDTNRLHFVNDGKAFVYGAEKMLKLNNEKILGLTLGTGFGASTNTQDGIKLSELNQTTENLYDISYKDGIAEDYFSTSWFLKKYKKADGEKSDQVQNVQQLSERLTSDQRVAEIFEEFGKNLSHFLKNKIELSCYNRLIIGGGIAKSSEYFNKDLSDKLPDEISINFIPNTPSCSIHGAVEHCKEKIKQTSEKKYRKTVQKCLPLEKPDSTPEGYDIYPTFELGENKINTGFETLADWISQKEKVVIDGFGGVLWNYFISRLNRVLVAKGKKVNWYSAEAALKDEEKIEEMVAPYLGGDDPIFGYKYPGEITDFFAEDLLNKIDAQSDGVTIIYGCGSALLNDDGSPLIYLDVPKNEIQYRSRAGSLFNFASNNNTSAKEQYKRFYFVDWPVLNRHKQECIPKIDVIVDEQRITEITWMEGEDFRKGLDQMSKNTLRARPWFESGVWGGDWIKENIDGLNQEVPNYAWSFELIVPENGIIFESDQKMLEVSFDSLLYHDNEAILGNSAELFGYEFPIRFDFLDTFNGQNLSLQCHPTADYMYEEFGEKFTQDETYYILDCGEEAEVYLGFQEDIDSNEFRSDLEKSHQQKKAVDVEKYVQTFDASKHDLFLIPSGTIHCSGEDNLVLEISNTPYIFTFKMYDWLRLDLDGNPRPINIERAFENLNFSYKGEKVKEDFLSTPEVIAEGPDWRVEKLPTHPRHFYAVERLELETALKVLTKGQCHVLSLVEGESIVVKNSGREEEISYAETFVVPAAADQYEIINRSEQPAKVVKAFVKDKDKILKKPFKE